MSLNLFCIGWLAMCPLEIPFLYYQRTGFHSKIKTKFHSKIILWVHSRHKGHALVSLIYRYNLIYSSSLILNVFCLILSIFEREFAWMRSKKSNAIELKGYHVGNISRSCLIKMRRYPNINPRTVQSHKTCVGLSRLIVTE